MFNGLDMNLGNLSRLSSAKSRSISPENFMGEKGQHIWMTPIGQWRNTILNGLDMNLGNLSRLSSAKSRSISPENFMGEKGQHIWMTPIGQWRNTILDGIKGQGQYVGTYMAWGVHNNGWWGEGEIKFFIDGDEEYPTICGTGTEDYFCGSYNFENPQTHDGYVPFSTGEGEIKFFIDGDEEYPTICGTGTEDYFCGSYNFENPQTHDGYVPFSTPYTGLQVVNTDKLYQVQKRFGLYRFHIMDPIRFEKDLKVTIQALGWREGGRYLPLQDDISSVAFWYQDLPCAPFPKLPDKDYLEII